MPHYADGTECKAGDLVLHKNSAGIRTLGIAHTINEQAQTCNCQVRELLMIVESEGKKAIIQTSGNQYASIKDLTKVA